MSKELSAPIEVVLAITSKCNLSCRHCGLGDSLNADGDLNTEELFSLIDELVKAKVFRIALFGGEPFCKKDIFEIMDYIHNKPVSINLSTNATLVTQEIANRLTGYRKLKAITVSLDGDNSKVMDAVRGKGAFSSAVRGIENMVAAGLKVSLRVTVTKFNFKRIREIALLGREIGALGLIYAFVLFIGNAASNLNELMLSAEERREALDLIKEVYQEFGDFVGGPCMGQAKMVEKLNSQKSNKSNSITVSSCGAATSKCGITADGWVTPCEVLYNLRAGNIQQERFLDIWQNSEVLKPFRKPMLYSLKRHSRCIECRYKRLCYSSNRCTYYYDRNLNIEDVDCLISKQHE